MKYNINIIYIVYNLIIFFIIYQLLKFHRYRFRKNVHQSLEKDYRKCGFPGAIGSTDCVHIAWDQVSTQLKVECTGKEGFATLTYSVACNRVSEGSKAFFPSAFYLQLGGNLIPRNMDAIRATNSTRKATFAIVFFQVFNFFLILRHTNERLIQHFSTKIREKLIKKERCTSSLAFVSNASVSKGAARVMVNRKEKIFTSKLTIFLPQRPIGLSLMKQQQFVMNAFVRYYLDG